MSGLKKLLDTLGKMQQDLEELNNLAEEDLLTPEMAVYRDQLTGWLSSLFDQINENVDMYLSSVPHPNREGFLNILEEEGDSGKTRLLKNLRNWDAQTGKYSYTRTSKDTVSFSARAVEDARIEGMAAGYYILNELENSDPLTEEDYFNMPYEDSDEVAPPVDSKFSFTDEDVELEDEIEDISLF